ncbi:hypothetical protein [Streptomyces triticiradicis]|uniref:Uncharacterized protein n=1 Tax=Streptomyces triticiradicis TaxID=2651189 RepID=A0A7J5D3F6_9ACTN|nr:hypothetical protein [Streptomyces triticiradicis]KAB1978535.1 hypothetical protein F8144_39550 [Streptomyces triticiradicis]
MGGGVGVPSGTDLKVYAPVPVLRQPRPHLGYRVPQLLRRLRVLLQEGCQPKAPGWNEGRTGIVPRVFRSVCHRVRLLVHLVFDSPP